MKTQLIKSRECLIPCHVWCTIKRFDAAGTQHGTLLKSLAMTSKVTYSLYSTGHDEQGDLFIVFHGSWRARWPIHCIPRVMTSKVTYSLYSTGHDEQGDLFIVFHGSWRARWPIHCIPRVHTIHRVSQNQCISKVGRGFGRNEGEQTGEVEIRTRRTFLAGVKHS